MTESPSRLTMLLSRHTRRRTFIAGLGSTVAWPVVARAQQRNPIKRIALIGATNGIADVPFLQELARLGWVEGQNVRIETLFEKDTRIIRAAAPFIVGSAPDLIVVFSTEPAEIFKGLTETIPIVFGFVADPVARNLVKSLARPGGNLTGFTNLVEFSLGGKWLGFLKELAPSVDRVLVLSDPANARFGSVAQEAALALHVTIQTVITTATTDAERGIEAFANQPGGGMIVIPYNLTIAERATITALAARHRLPAVYGADAFASVGGLLSYAPDADDLARHIAQYADRILKGAKPADLPVQTPTKFRLVINARTAKALALTIPPALLASADEVIE